MKRGRRFLDSTSSSGGDEKGPANGYSDSDSLAKSDKPNDAAPSNADRPLRSKLGRILPIVLSDNNANRRELVNDRKQTDRDVNNYLKGEHKAMHANRLLRIDQAYRRAMWGGIREIDGIDAGTFVQLLVEFDGTSGGVLSQVMEEDQHATRRKGYRRPEQNASWTCCAMRLRTIRMVKRYPYPHSVRPSPPSSPLSVECQIHDEPHGNSAMEDRRAQSNSADAGCTDEAAESEEDVKNSESDGDDYFERLFGDSQSPIEKGTRPDSRTPSAGVVGSSSCLTTNSAKGAEGGSAVLSTPQATMPSKPKMATYADRGASGQKGEAGGAVPSLKSAGSSGAGVVNPNASVAESIQKTTSGSDRFPRRLVSASFDDAKSDSDSAEQIMDGPPITYDPKITATVNLPSQILYSDGSTEFKKSWTEGYAVFTQVCQALENGKAIEGVEMLVSLMADGASKTSCHYVTNLFARLCGYHGISRYDSFGLYVHSALCLQHPNCNSARSQWELLWHYLSPDLPFKNKNTYSGAAGRFLGVLSRLTKAITRNQGKIFQRVRQKSDSIRRNLLRVGDSVIPNGGSMTERKQGRVSDRCSSAIHVENPFRVKEIEGINDAIDILCPRKTTEAAVPKTAWDPKSKSRSSMVDPNHYYTRMATAVKEWHGHVRSGDDSDEPLAEKVLLELLSGGEVQSPAETRWGSIGPCSVLYCAIGILGLHTHLVDPILHCGGNRWLRKKDFNTMYMVCALFFTVASGPSDRIWYRMQSSAGKGGQDISDEGERTSRKQLIQTAKDTISEHLVETLPKLAGPGSFFRQLDRRMRVDSDGDGGADTVSNEIGVGNSDSHGPTGLTDSFFNRSCQHIAFTWIVYLGSLAVRMPYGSLDEFYDAWSRADSLKAQHELVDTIITADEALIAKADPQSSSLRQLSLSLHPKTPMQRVNTAAKLFAAYKDCTPHSSRRAESKHSSAQRYAYSSRGLSGLELVSAKVNSGGTQYKASKRVNDEYNSLLKEAYPAGGKTVPTKHTLHVARNITRNLTMGLKDLSDDELERYTKIAEHRTAESIKQKEKDISAARNVLNSLSATEVDKYARAAREFQYHVRAKEVAVDRIIHGEEGSLPLARARTRAQTYTHGVDEAVHPLSSEQFSMKGTRAHESDFVQRVVQGFEVTRYGGSSIKISADDVKEGFQGFAGNSTDDDSEVEAREKEKKGQKNSRLNSNEPKPHPPKYLLQKPRGLLKSSWPAVPPASVDDGAQNSNVSGDRDRSSSCNAGGSVCSSVAGVDHSRGDNAYKRKTGGGDVPSGARKIEDEVEGESDGGVEFEERSFEKGNEKGKKLQVDGDAGEGEGDLPEMIKSIGGVDYGFRTTKPSTGGKLSWIPLNYESRMKYLFQFSGRVPANEVNPDQMPPDRAQKLRNTKAAKKSEYLRWALSSKDMKWKYWADLGMTRKEKDKKEDTKKKKKAKLHGGDNGNGDEDGETNGAGSRLKLKNPHNNKQENSRASGSGLMQEVCSSRRAIVSEVRCGNSNKIKTGGGEASSATKQKQSQFGVGPSSNVRSRLNLKSVDSNNSASSSNNRLVDRCSEQKMEIDLATHNQNPDGGVKVPERVLLVLVEGDQPMPSELYMVCFWLKKGGGYAACKVVVEDQSQMSTVKKKVLGTKTQNRQGKAVGYSRLNQCGGKLTNDVTNGAVGSQISLSPGSIVSLRTIPLPEMLTKIPVPNRCFLRFYVVFRIQTALEVDFSCIRFEVIDEYVPLLGKADRQRGKAAIDVDGEGEVGKGESDGEENAKARGTGYQIWDEADMDWKVDYQRDPAIGIQPTTGTMTTKPQRKLSPSEAQKAKLEADRKELEEIKKDVRMVTLFREIKCDPDRVTCILNRGSRHFALIRRYLNPTHVTISVRESLFLTTKTDGQKQKGVRRIGKDAVSIARAYVEIHMRRIVYLVKTLHRNPAIVDSMDNKSDMEKKKLRIEYASYMDSYGYRQFRSRVLEVKRLQTQLQRPVKTGGTMPLDEYLELEQLYSLSDDVMRYLQVQKKSSDERKAELEDEPLIESDSDVADADETDGE